MPRVSLVALLAFVVFCGVSFAALRKGDELWAGLSLLLTAGMFAASALCVAYRRGARRAAWAGFTLFGGAYLLMTKAPGCATEIAPRLPTTYAFRQVSARLSFGPYAQIEALEADIAEALRHYRSIEQARYPTPIQGASKRRDPELREIQHRMTDLEGQLANLTSPPRGGPNLTASQEQVGHCAFAWLAGALGALIGVRLYRTRGAEDARSRA